MLMNLETCDWDDDKLKHMTVPKAMLPKVRPSIDPDIYGYTLADGPVGGKVPV